MVKELEKTYTSTANVYIIENKEENGVVVGDEKKLLYENIKCGVSFRKASSITIQNTVSENRIQVKLFLNNEYNIPINSIVEVNCENKLYKCIHTSIASIYDTHQEITLEIQENG